MFGRSKTKPVVSFETDVREYESMKAYEKDAKKLAKDGWEVVQTEWYQPKSGIGRKAAIGIFAAVFKPSKKLMVTYRRQIEM